jgi:hypothetical protein
MALSGKRTALRNEEHGACPVVAISGMVQCRLSNGVLGVDSHKVGIAESRNRKYLTLVSGHMQWCQLQADPVTPTPSCVHVCMQPPGTAQTSQSRAIVPGTHSTHTHHTHPVHHDSNMDTVSALSKI